MRTSDDYLTKDGCFVERETSLPCLKPFDLAGRSDCETVAFPFFVEENGSLARTVTRLVTHRILKKDHIKIVG